MHKRKLVGCTFVLALAISLCACSSKAIKLDNLIESPTEMPTMEVPTIEVPSVEVPTTSVPTIEVPSEDYTTVEINIGDYITFGTYVQDNDTYNGKEAIEWIVLDVKDGKALVISRFAIDVQKYNEIEEATTWEKCSLRKWLNSEFINVAFSEEEKNKIPTVVVSADRNSIYHTYPGNSTEDKVFLLSMQEVNKYFVNDEDKICEATGYVHDELFLHDEIHCSWWLRTQGEFEDEATVVLNNGNVYAGGISVESVNSTAIIGYGGVDIGVRPALWIEIDY